MGDKVYVLTEIYPYETAIVLGVYSNKELAESEKFKAEKNDDTNGYNDFEIEEFTINE